jgi:Ca2+-binding RTX toxin-like protein
VRLFTARLACACAALACLALGVPAVAPAFQNVTLVNGTLRITGDAGKTTDLVTIKYDPATDEYVITHDILTAPPGCRFEGNGPPYKLLRCPAKGIGLIIVDTGNDSDTFRLEDMTYTNLSQDGIWYPPDLLEVVVLMGTGNDKYQETAVQPPTLPPAGVVAKRAIDMGGGNDGAAVGPGASTIVFGDGSARLTIAGGTNQAALGRGNSQVSLAGGVNAVRLGDGNSQVVASNGTNTVNFGNGNNVFTGGPGADSATFGTGSGVFTGNDGDDSAIFGAGVNRFYGGPGVDSALLGAGNDFGFGGPGADKLRGGPGRDRLYGGADYDLLNGGPGKPDRCYGGAGGAMPISCEVGVQYMP